MVNLVVSRIVEEVRLVLELWVESSEFRANLENGPNLGREARGIDG